MGVRVRFPLSALIEEKGRREVKSYDVDIKNPTFTMTSPPGYCTNQEVRIYIHQRLSYSIDISSKDNRTSITMDWRNLNGTSSS